MGENEFRIKCMIIDDEPPAHRLLEKYISDIPFLELVAKCMNVFEASSILHQKDIDLLFLDINMQKMSGMDFLRTLKSSPYVIITSAYSEYALESFELDVTDYLQKPFSFDRFFQAVNKVSKQMKPGVPDPSKTPVGLPGKADDDFIFVRENKIEYRVNISDILYLESVGDYIKVITVNRNYIVYDSLKNFEDLLSKNSFKRVHRSFIIPFSRIDSIEGNTIKIGEQNIPVGTTYRKEFFDTLREYKLLH